jgi:glycosyltransferase involved in cell wall biosynthesis
MKISIITPTYNVEKSIRETLESVNSQNYRNFEHILIDGKSSDRTCEIIKNYNSYKLTYISECDNGLYDAINKGIKLSTGDIIGILNADDRYYSAETLKIIHEIFMKNPDIDCVYGNLEFVNDSHVVVRKWKSKNFESGLFEKSWTPAHPTFYCRRKVYDELNQYKVNYQIASDVDFMYRALEIRKYKSHFIEQNLVQMTIGGKSTRGLSSLLIIIREMKRVFAENGKKLNMAKYLFFKVMKIREFI